MNNVVPNINEAENQIVVVESVQPLQKSADNLKQQVERAVIESNENQATAGDLMKLINNQINKQEEVRTALVKPLNDHVKFINDQFRPHMTILTNAKGALKLKMDAWAASETKRMRAEAAEKQKAAEEELLKRAIQNEENGNTEGAEALMDVAETVTKQAPVKTPIARGNLGSSVSTRSTWHYEIVNKLEFIKAVAEGKLPLDAVLPNDKFLKDLATKKKIEKTNYGVRLYENIGSATR